MRNVFRNKWIIGATALLLFVIILKFTWGYLFFALFNTWHLTTDSVTYYIPNESNIFDFGPIVWNDGSGEWWIYGGDSKNIYYAHPDSALGTYFFIEKKLFSEHGYIDTVYDSWPKENVMCNTIRRK